MANPNQTAPSEEKLRLLVANGGECVEIAQSLIDKFKMPFIIQKISESEYRLRSAFSGGELELQKFITVDPDMLKMKDEAIKAAQTPYEVLVYGETGTGKEIIACSQIGKREGPIKTVNCAGFPRELIESELFGHVRGAFTGAMSDKEGIFQSALDGLVFLDEIGDLPMEVQAKFLRAIQYKVVRRVGSNKEEKIACKFVCATNRDLKDDVKAGKFRQDLYARLSTLELDITPLRERKCDIVPICMSLPGGVEFLKKYQDDLLNGLFDLSLNVRSLQHYVIRYATWGRVTKER